MEASPTSRRESSHHELRRGVSFADALEKHLESEGNENEGDSPASATKSPYASERTDTLDSDAPSVRPEEMAPAWLMATAPESADVGSTEDLMDEFLQDEDMLNLEVICAKWKGIEESDLEVFARKCPETAKSLLLGDKHIQEFLSYRRQLNEKHARKASVKHKLEAAKVRKDGLGAVAEDDDDDSDEEFGKEDDSEHPSTEPSSPGAHSPRNANQANNARKTSVQSVTAGADKQRKESLLLPAGASPKASVSMRRGSMAGGHGAPTSPRLAGVGRSIIGKEESIAENPNPVKRQTVGGATAGRRGSISINTKAVAGKERYTSGEPGTPQLAAVREGTPQGSGSPRARKTMR